MLHPVSPAPQPSTRNTTTGSSVGLQLHDPQLETRTPAPPRVSSSANHKLENNAGPSISSSTTLNKKRQQWLLCRSPVLQPSSRNTNSSSYTGLQLHDPQTRKQRSTLYLQLHNPQRETPTPAPPRVCSSTKHKLENNVSPCISSSTTVNEKHQKWLLHGSPTLQTSNKNTNTGSSTDLQ
ncbi:uncharacterized protein LOC126957448 isoform X2 [Macaca thibetana thibetana]|uniref:uncharacterized protein LOC126957448 isoform X2 n=1 Tax=Macaca thibetana thibetana TaxID=257877 RepID=UPI0021BC9DAE|nr:uncharacterized protein LOC126957448 isoform X2 [Macaca thibetana thibetana]